MNLLLPLKGTISNKRAFLEKEEDSAWDDSSLVLLEVDP